MITIIVKTQYKPHDDDVDNYDYPGTTQCMLQALGAWRVLYTSLLISCRMSRGPVRLVKISLLLWLQKIEL